jgi:hypothetical protein
MKTLVATGLVVVVGLLAGFAGSVIAQRSYAAQPPPATSAVNSSRRTPPSIQQENSEESCQTEAPLPAGPAPAASVDEPADVLAQRPNSMNREEQVKVEVEEQSKRLIAHEQEPRDARWAGEMEATLVGAFEELSLASKIHYSDVNCRYVSCSAKLSWPNGEEARSDLGKVATLHAGLPCTRFVVLDSIPAGETAVTGTAVFDCQHARLDGAVQPEK